MLITKTRTSEDTLNAVIVLVISNPDKVNPVTSVIIS